jgi:hypothetical protein
VCVRVCVCACVRVRACVCACACVCVWCTVQSELKPEVAIQLCNSMYEFARESK